MTATRKAPDLREQAEGNESETPTDERETVLMSEPSFMLDAEQAERVREWCGRIAVEHAEQSRPILDGEPRLAELIEASGLNYRADAPERRGHAYAFHLGHLSPWPLPLPAWAERAQVDIVTYPEIAVVFRSPKVTAGRSHVVIAQQIICCALDFTDGDGSRHQVGFDGACRHYLDLGDDLEELRLSDAVSHAKAILEAVAAFERASAAGTVGEASR